MYEWPHVNDHLVPELRQFVLGLSAPGKNLYGAGNTAKFNALSPRCIGVSCDADPRGVPVITWAQPASIVTGTPLGPDQLNATASVPGCLTYTPAAGTVLDAGGYSLVVEFVPDDLVNYQPISWGVSLEVTRPPFP